MPPARRTIQRGEAPAAVRQPRAWDCGIVRDASRLMPISGLFDRFVRQSMRDNFGQASRRRPRRCEAQVLAVRADQENETRVIDLGPRISRWISLGVIDLVGQSDLLDGARA